MIFLNKQLMCQRMTIRKRCLLIRQTFTKAYKIGLFCVSSGRPAAMLRRRRPLTTAERTCAVKVSGGGDRSPLRHVSPIMRRQEEDD